MVGSTITLTAQPEFFLNGNALLTSDSCYQLTSNQNGQAGSIWNGDKINLNESFEVAVDLFLGCQDLQGADGMVFGLQPISTSIGTGGGDIGFGGVIPSLGIEFDTYQNIDYDDPVFDHIAIFRDGDVRHNVPQSSLTPPIQANINNPNVEDCEYHPMLIQWDAETQTLSVFFDCELRLTYTGDVVNDIFNGDPEVFWGFTSATGGLNNRHEICFSYTSILDGLVDQTICPNESVQLEASGGVSYQWTPTTGLSNPAIANPIATPEETTLYTVEILNDCGIPFFDDVLVTVENNQFTVDIVSNPDNLTEIPGGTDFDLSANIDPSDDNNYSYVWSAMLGSVIAMPDSANTAVTSSINQIGTETIAVQITSENGCTQEANISFEIISQQYDIPNTFTPNGDGTNDSFGIITTAALEDYRCQIFNRWGNLVFESNDATEYWDGTYEDESVSADVYIYLINLTLGGVRFEEKGDVTLIR